MWLPFQVNVGAFCNFAFGCIFVCLHSVFCCCTAIMEQAANGAETAAVDGFVSL